MFGENNGPLSLTVPSRVDVSIVPLPDFIDYGRVWCALWATSIPNLATITGLWSTVESNIFDILERQQLTPTRVAVANVIRSAVLLGGDTSALDRQFHRKVPLSTPLKDEFNNSNRPASVKGTVTDG